MQDVDVCSRINFTTQTAAVRPTIDSREAGSVLYTGGSADSTVVLLTLLSACMRFLKPFANCN